jgi:hypothetical protein
MRERREKAAFVGVIVGNIGEMIILVAALATPKWVFMKGHSVSVEGGLLLCEHCGTPFKGEFYTQAAHNPLCDQSFPDYSGYCRLFSHLSAAGVIYLCFSLISLLFTLLITFKMALLVLDSKKLPCSSLAWTLLSVLSAGSFFLGILGWSAVTGASFYGNCDDNWILDGSEPHVCSLTGPVLALVTLALAILLSTLFCCVINKEKRHLSPISEANNVELSSSAIQIHFS